MMHPKLQAGALACASLGPLPNLPRFRGSSAGCRCLRVFGPSLLSSFKFGSSMKSWSALHCHHRRISKMCVSIYLSVCLSTYISKFCPFKKTASSRSSSLSLIDYHGHEPHEAKSWTKSTCGTPTCTNSSILDCIIE